jgi:hypothetical protein
MMEWPLVEEDAEPGIVSEGEAAAEAESSMGAAECESAVMPDSESAVMPDSESAVGPDSNRSAEARGGAGAASLRAERERDENEERGYQQNAPHRHIIAPFPMQGSDCGGTNSYFGGSSLGPATKSSCARTAFAAAARELNTPTIPSIGSLLCSLCWMRE